MGELENVETGITNEARLKTLATEIRTIQENGRKVMLLYSIQIGERLKEAKEKAGHGNWESWLKDNTDISLSTAGNLIKLHEKYGVQQQSILGDASVSDEVMEKLSYTQAVALLGIKDDVERAAFIRENDVADMSKRELEAKIKELKEANSQLVEATKKADSLEERLNKLNNERVVTENRIRELEGALADAKNTPIEQAVAYEIPKETEEELEKLRAREKELEAELMAFHEAQKQTAPPADNKVQRLKFRLEIMQDDFNEAVGIINSMGDEKNKYRQILINICKSMVDLQTEEMAEESL